MKSLLDKVIQDESGMDERGGVFVMNGRASVKGITDPVMEPGMLVGGVKRVRRHREVSDVATEQLPVYSHHVPIRISKGLSEVNMNFSEFNIPDETRFKDICLYLLEHT